MLAHEKWFTGARPEPDFGFLVEPATLAFVLSAIAVAIIWRLVARKLPTPELGFLRPLEVLSPWVPRMLAIHAGVSLLAQAVDGTYLAPGLDLPPNPCGTGLAIVEGVVGVWLITGVRIRWAAGLLVLAGPLGMLAYGPVAIIERADLLGIALFLAVLPPGPDRYGAAAEDERRILWAVWYLRVGAGLALVVLALTEKLGEPRPGPAVPGPVPGSEPVRPGRHSHLRRGVRALRRGGGDPVRAAADLGVASADRGDRGGGPVQRHAVFFGYSELIGHLPVYGAMLALLVYGSDPRYAGLVPVLNPWRREASAPASG